MGSGKIADDRNDSILSLKLLQPLKQLLGRKEILPAALAVGLEKHLLESRVHHGVPAANRRESKIEVLFPKCTIDVVDFSHKCSSMFCRRMSVRMASIGCAWAI